jgi:predicted nucleic-acid-binding Zn-ribbon protein
MPASELSPSPAPLPSPELAPKPVPQLDAKLSSLAENIYESGDAMAVFKPSPKPAPLPSPEPAPKPVPQLHAKLSSPENSSAEAWLRCPKCGMRELVELDETQIQAMRRLKGLVRSCPACGATSLWRRTRV